MCLHGNFPASCTQCNGDSEATTVDIEGKAQDRLGELVVEVTKKMDAIDAKLAAGKEVTPQEVFEMMVQMDADLSDEYGRFQDEWISQHPERSGKPISEEAKRPEYFQLYDRRVQILDRLSRETLTPLGVLLRGGELPQKSLGGEDIEEGEKTENNNALFVKQNTTKAEAGALRKFGYAEEDIQTDLSEDDLVAQVRMRQNKGMDVAFITNESGKVTKLVVKEPISQTMTADLIQQEGFRVLPASNRDAAALRKEMEEILEKPNSYKDVKFSTTSVFVKEK